MIPRVRPIAAVATVLAGLAAAAPTARADQIVGDVSARLIEITSNYTGAEIVMFGARTGRGDIVIVVRGPSQPEVVRRKSQIAGIWINAASAAFNDVPGFYAVAATRPLLEIAPAHVWAALQIGTENLPLLPRGASAEGQTAAAPFREALIRSKETDRLYHRDIKPIEVSAGTLFRASVTLPAHAPDGGYYVTFYLVNRGAVVETRNVFFFINKAGFGRTVYDFAHQQPLAYGALAVAIAALGGWLAAALFRRS